MSYWSVKRTGKDWKDLIVIRHKLRGINYRVKGVRFRESYAVVEKDGKIYKELKKIPTIKGCEEFPLSHLKTLKFITRDRDVLTVYGRDVYDHYLQAVNKEKEEKVVEQKAVSEDIHVQNGSCAYRLKTGELCKHDAVKCSPSQHCMLHFLEDPKLEDLDLDIPKFIPKNKKKKTIYGIIKKLEKRKLLEENVVEEKTAEEAVEPTVEATAE